MERELSMSRLYDSKRNSTHKSLRTVLLAILFHSYWPKRLSRYEITSQLAFYYGDTSTPALYRDLQTLTGIPVEELLEPDDERLAEWCMEQRDLKRLAITYDRHTVTFGLAESFFTIDISEDEARAFVALRDGFTPGTPYAEAVQNLLQRWQWLFSAASHQMVQQKQRRQARPVLLPLSPVVDYSQHNEIILQLDRALKEGAYVFDLSTFIDYRVDRIRPGTLRKEHERYYPGGRRRPGVKVTYWVSPMLARHNSLSVRLRDQHVTMLDNDRGARVEGYARSLWWARRLLLGYGEQVKALEPPELVQMMQETAEAMYHLYEKE